MVSVCSVCVFALCVCVCGVFVRVGGVRLGCVQVLFMRMCVSVWMRVHGACLSMSLCVGRACVLCIETCVVYRDKSGMNFVGTLL